MIYFMVAVAIIPIVVGLLLGMLRGSRRALLRLVLILLCIVAAFCLKGVVTDMVMEMEFDGQTLEQMIMSELPPDYASMSEVIMPIISLIIMAVVFLVLFLAVEFVSWVIIYPICKIFVKKARKKADGKYGSKHSLIGGAIGLVQGVAVALVMCVILNGLFCNVAEVMRATEDFQDNAQATAYASDVETDGEPTENPSQEADFTKLLYEYADSKICKAINGIGGNKMFDVVVSAKTEQGDKITLTGQLNALTGLIKIGGQLQAIEGMDMKGGLSIETADDVVEIFNKLDEICQDLSPESKQTMNNIVKLVADNILPEDIGVDITVIDFANVSFKNEGEVIAQLSTYKEEDFESLTEAQAKEKATEIVNVVMESDIILPLLASNEDFTVGLSGDQKVFAQDVIDELAANPEADSDKIEMLKTFFGLNDSQPEQ